MKITTRNTTIALILAFALGVAAGAWATAGMTNFSGVDITPKAYQTNSLVVRDSSGTAKVTVTKAGATTFGGAVSAGSTLAVSGNTTVGGTLGVTGATTLSSTLAVTGNVSLSGNLTSSDTGDIGWSLQSAANQACNTTCTSACVFGQDTTTYAIVNCADATADVCVCAGSS